jgi:hypothetical protein
MSERHLIYSTGERLLHPMLQEHSHSFICSCWLKWFKSTYMLFNFGLIYYTLDTFQSLICFVPLHIQVWLSLPIFSLTIILDTEKRTLYYSFRNFHPVCHPLCSLMAFAMLFAYFSMTFINLTVPPPWGFFGFLIFFNSLLVLTLSPLNLTHSLVREWSCRTFWW